MTNLERIIARVAAPGYEPPANYPAVLASLLRDGSGVMPYHVIAELVEQVDDLTARLRRYEDGRAEGRQGKQP